MEDVDFCVERKIEINTCIIINLKFTRFSEKYLQHQLHTVLLYYQIPKRLILKYFPYK